MPSKRKTKSSTKLKPVKPSLKKKPLKLKRQGQGKHVKYSKTQFSFSRTHPSKDRKKSKTIVPCSLKNTIDPVLEPLSGGLSVGSSQERVEVLVVEPDLPLSLGVGVVGENCVKGLETKVGSLLDSSSKDENNSDLEVKFVCEVEKCTGHQKKIVKTPEKKSRVKVSKALNCKGKTKGEKVISKFVRKKDLSHSVRHPLGKFRHAMESKKRMVDSGKKSGISTLPKRRAIKPKSAKALQKGLENLKSVSLASKRKEKIPSIITCAFENKDEISVGIHCRNIKKAMPVNSAEEFPLVDLIKEAVSSSHENYNSEKLSESYKQLESVESPFDTDRTHDDDDSPLPFGKDTITLKYHSADATRNEKLSAVVRGLYSTDNLRLILENANALTGNSLVPIPPVGLSLEIVFAAVNCGMFSDNHVYAWIQCVFQKRKKDCTKICQAQFQLLRELYNYLAVKEVKYQWKCILENVRYCYPKCKEFCLLFESKDFVKDEVLAFYKNFLLRQDPPPGVLLERGLCESVEFMSANDDVTTSALKRNINDVMNSEIMRTANDVTNSGLMRRASGDGSNSKLMKSSSDDVTNSELLESTNDDVTNFELMPAEVGNVHGFDMVTNSSNTLLISGDNSKAMDANSMVKEMEISDSSPSTSESVQGKLLVSFGCQYDGELTKCHLCSYVREEVLKAISSISQLREGERCNTPNKKCTILKGGLSGKEEVIYVKQLECVLKALHHLLANGNYTDEDLSKVVRKFCLDLIQFNSLAQLQKTELENMKMEIENKVVHNRELGKTIKEANKKLESRDRRIRSLEEELKNMKSFCKSKQEEQNRPMPLNPRSSRRHSLDLKVGRRTEGKATPPHSAKHDESNLKTLPQDASWCSPAPPGWCSPAPTGWCSPAPPGWCSPAPPGWSSPAPPDCLPAIPLPSGLYMARPPIPSMGITQSELCNTHDSSYHSLSDCGEMNVREVELLSKIDMLNKTIVQNANAAKLHEELTDQLCQDFNISKDRLEECYKKIQMLEDSLVQEEYRSCSLEQRLKEFVDKETSLKNDIQLMDSSSFSIAGDALCSNGMIKYDNVLGHMKELENRLVTCSRIVSGKDQTIEELEKFKSYLESEVKKVTASSESLKETVKEKDLTICQLEKSSPLETVQDMELQIQSLNEERAKFQEQLKARDETVKHHREEAVYFTGVVCGLYAKLIDESQDASTAVAIGREGFDSCNFARNNCSRVTKNDEEPVSGIEKQHERCSDTRTFMKDREIEMLKLISVLREVHLRLMQPLPQESVWREYIDLEILVSDVTLLIFSCLETNEKLYSYSNYSKHVDESISSLPNDSCLPTDVLDKTGRKMDDIDTDQISKSVLNKLLSAREDDFYSRKMDAVGDNSEEQNVSHIAENLEALGKDVSISDLNKDWENVENGDVSNCTTVKLKDSEKYVSVSDSTPSNTTVDWSKRLLSGIESCYHRDEKFYPGKQSAKMVVSVDYDGKRHVQMIDESCDVNVPSSLQRIRDMYSHEETAEVHDDQTESKMMKGEDRVKKCESSDAKSYALMKQEVEECPNLGIISVDDGLSEESLERVNRFSCALVIKRLQNIKGEKDSKRLKGAYYGVCDSLYDHITSDSDDQFQLSYSEKQIASQEKPIKVKDEQIFEGKDSGMQIIKAENTPLDKNQDVKIFLAAENYGNEAFLPQNNIEIMAPSFRDHGDREVITRPVIKKETFSDGTGMAKTADKKRKLAAEEDISKRTPKMVELLDSKGNLCSDAERQKRKKKHKKDKTSKKVMHDGKFRSNAFDLCEVEAHHEKQDQIHESISKVDKFMNREREMLNQEIDGSFGNFKENDIRKRVIKDYLVKESVESNSQEIHEQQKRNLLRDVLVARLWTRTYSLEKEKDELKESLRLIEEDHNKVIVMLQEESKALYKVMKEKDEITSTKDTFLQQYREKKHENKKILEDLKAQELLLSSCQGMRERTLQTKLEEMEIVLKNVNSKLEQKLCVTKDQGDYIGELRREKALVEKKRTYLKEKLKLMVCTITEKDQEISKLHLEKLQVVKDLEVWVEQVSKNKRCMVDMFEEFTCMYESNIKGHLKNDIPFSWEATKYQELIRVKVALEEALKMLCEEVFAFKEKINSQLEIRHGKTRKQDFLGRMGKDYCCKKALNNRTEYKETGSDEYNSNAETQVDGKEINLVVNQEMDNDLKKGKQEEIRSIDEKISETYEPTQASYCDIMDETLSLDLRTSNPERCTDGSDDKMLKNVETYDTLQNLSGGVATIQQNLKDHEMLVGEKLLAESTIIYCSAENSAEEMKFEFVDVEDFTEGTTDISVELGHYPQETRSEEIGHTVLMESNEPNIQCSDARDFEKAKLNQELKSVNENVLDGNGDKVENIDCQENPMEDHKDIFYHIDTSTNLKMSKSKFWIEVSDWSNVEDEGTSETTANGHQAEEAEIRKAIDIRKVEEKSLQTSLDSLKTEKRLEEYIDAIIPEKEDLHKSLDAFSLSKIELQSVIEKLTTENATLQDAIGSLTAEREEMQKIMAYNGESLVKALELLCAEKEELAVIKTELSQEKEMLSRSLELLTNDKQNLEKNLEVLNIEKVNLSSEKVSPRASLDFFEKEKCELEKCVDRIGAEKETIQKSLDALNTDNVELNTCIEQLIAEREDLQNTIGDERETIQKSVDALTIDNVELHKTIRSLNAEREVLQNVIGSNKSKNEALQKSLESLGTENEKLIGNISQLITDKGELSKSLELFIAEKENFQKSFEVLAVERDTFSASFKSLEMEKRLLDESIDRMVKEKETLEKSFDALSADKEMLKSSNDTLLSEKEALQKAISFFTAEKEQLIEEKKTREKSFGALSADREMLKSSNDILLSEKEELQKAISSLSAERGQLLEEKETREKSLGAFSADKETLKSSNDILISEMEALQKAISSFNAEREQLLEEKETREKSLGALNADKETLKSSNDILISEKEALQKAISSFNAEREQLLEEKATREKSLGALSADKDTLKSSNDILISEKDALQKAIRSFTAEREELQRLIVHHSSENVILLSSVQLLEIEKGGFAESKIQLKKEKEDLWKSLELSRKENKSLKERVEFLNTEVDNLHNKLREKESDLVMMKEKLDFEVIKVNETYQCNQNFLEELKQKDILVDLQNKHHGYVEQQDSVLENAIIEVQHQSEVFMHIIEDLRTEREALSKETKEVRVDLNLEREKLRHLQCTLEIERERFDANRNENQKLHEDERWEHEDRLAKVENLKLDKKEMTKAIMIQKAQYLEVEEKNAQLRCRLRDIEKRHEQQIKQKLDFWKSEVLVLDNQFKELKSYNAHLIDQVNYLNDYRVLIRRALNLRSNLKLSSIPTSIDIQYLEQLCCTCRNLESQMETLKSSMWEEQLRNESLGKVLSEEQMRAAASERKLREQEAEMLSISKSLQEELMHKEALSRELHEEIDRKERTILKLKEQLKVEEAEKQMQQNQETIELYAKSAQVNQLRFETMEAESCEEHGKSERLTHLLDEERVKNANISHDLCKERSSYLSLLGEFNHMRKMSSPEEQSPFAMQADKECQPDGTLDDVHLEELHNLQYNWDLEKVSSRYFCKNLIEEYKNSKDTLEHVVDDLKVVVHNAEERKNRIEDVLALVGAESTEGPYNDLEGDPFTH